MYVYNIRLELSVSGHCVMNAPHGAVYQNVYIPVKRNKRKSFNYWKQI